MSRKKAFTLIELLVVIAIIALLMAILLPGLKKARSQTWLLICKTNMKSIYAAMNMYSMENNDWFSIPGGEPGRVYNLNTKEQRNWFIRYSYYIPEKKVLRCPATTDQEVAFFELRGGGTPTEAGDIMVWDADRGPFKGERVTVTYTMNEFLIAGMRTPAELPGDHDFRFTEVCSLAAGNNWMGVVLSDGWYRVNAWGDWRPDTKTIIPGYGPDSRARFRHIADSPGDLSWNADPNPLVVEKDGNGKAVFLCGDGRIGDIDRNTIWGLPQHGYRTNLRPSDLH